MPSIAFDSQQNLKRGFFVSLAIHGAFFLLLLIAASIPHRFHFDQMTFVELQGMQTAVKGSNPAGTAIANTAVSKSAKLETKTPAPKIATRICRSR